MGKTPPHQALFDIVWQFIEVCAGIRSRRRGNALGPWGLQNRVVVMIVEAILFGGSLACFIMLIMLTNSHVNEDYLFRDEVIITVLIGLVMYAALAPPSPSILSPHCSTQYKEVIVRG